MIYGQLNYLSIAQKMGSAITDMGDPEAVTIEEHGYDRGSHPLELGIISGEIQDRGVGVLNRILQGLSGGNIEIPVEILSHELNRHAACLVASAVASHAICNDEKSPLSRTKEADKVLVLLSNIAYFTGRVELMTFKNN
jgi:hypothetical protein